MEFLDRIRYGKQYGYEVLFKNQPPQSAGKVGVIIAESGLPEDYDFEFYANFMEHVFHYTLPPFLTSMILADKGIGLIDPDNPLAREEFKPKQLVDSHGLTTTKTGKPYVECLFKWIPPGVKKNFIVTCHPPVIGTVLTHFIGTLLVGTTVPPTCT